MFLSSSLPFGISHHILSGRVTVLPCVVLNALFSFLRVNFLTAGFILLAHGCGHSVRHDHLAVGLLPVF